MKKIILFILFVGLLCGGYYSTILFKEENLSSKAALDSTYTVSRMDLEIGLQVGGSVNAKNKKKIKLEAKVATKKYIQ